MIRSFEFGAAVPSVTSRNKKFDFDFVNFIYKFSMPPAALPGAKLLKSLTNGLGESVL
jgi:hypothetical protein